jgi:hypothetical protein
MEGFGLDYPEDPDKFSEVFFNGQMRVKFR